MSLLADQYAHHWMPPRTAAPHTDMMAVQGQVHLKLFNPAPNKRRTVLLFLFRDRTRTPLERLAETWEGDLQQIWAALAKPDGYEQFSFADFFEARPAGCHGVATWRPSLPHPSCRIRPAALPVTPAAASPTAACALQRLQAHAQVRVTARSGKRPARRVRCQRRWHTGRGGRCSRRPCVQVQYASLPNYEEKEDDFRAEAYLLRRRFTEEGAQAPPRSCRTAAAQVAGGLLTCLVLVWHRLARQRPGPVPTWH